MPALWRAHALWLWFLSSSEDVATVRRSLAFEAAEVESGLDDTLRGTDEEVDMETTCSRR